MGPPRLTKALIDAQARFISESKARIGKCITFGCTTKHQFSELGLVLRAINKNWRKSVVGRKGYISVPERAGMLGHRVAWGDQDSMVRLIGHIGVLRGYWETDEHW
jgi:hypothetical protein